MLRRSPNSRGSVALIVLALLAAVSFPGCSDEQHQTGTAVQDTPEAQAGRKASMDGMKAIMKQQGKAGSGPSHR